ncbi:hypothetical protein [Parasphingorhabdus pacifica]
MVIDQKRWVRGLLLAQPVIAWPGAWWVWSPGGGIGLALAVLVLWVSTLLCVFAIVAPLRRETSRC